jgi:hypothetical protein
MRPIRHLGRKVIAAFIAFSITPLYTQANLVNSIAADLKEANGSTSQDVMGKLITRGNKPIIVNGNMAAPGTTILDGATLETPEGVGATVLLGSLGDVDLAPKTVVTINYIPEQRAMASIHYLHAPPPMLKVKLIHGCAIVRSKPGVVGSIETPDGTVTPVDQPDSGSGQRADVCFPIGAITPKVNTGAAANAGAGAGGGTGAAATTGSTATVGVPTSIGLSGSRIAAIVVGAIAAVIIVVVATGEDDNVSGIGTGANL